MDIHTLPSLSAVYGSEVSVVLCPPLSCFPSTWSAVPPRMDSYPSPVGQMGHQAPRTASRPASQPASQADTQIFKSGGWMGKVHIFYVPTHTRVYACVSYAGPLH
mmetsp:Transcript_14430/g.34446  ORF Transcript_14430/g.34446 Transcript_14430/m.34446 type:complete len:105 (-) Transcript_14430:1058-1372(-)